MGQAGRNGPRIRIGAKAAAIQPMERAIGALRKNLGREPTESELAEWQEEIDRLAMDFRNARQSAIDSVGPANCREELGEIRKAARALVNRLGSLSRDSYYLLRLGERGGDLPFSDYTPQNVQRQIENADEAKSPQSDEDQVWLHEVRTNEINESLQGGSVLLKRMRGLEKLASIAIENIPNIPNGSHTIYHGQTGGADLRLITRCFQTMDRLSGGISRVSIFSRAIRELAFPHDAMTDDWGKNHFRTVTNWWKSFGCYAERIIDADEQWHREPHPESESFINGIARILGLSPKVMGKVLSYAWDPLNPRRTP